MKGRSIVVIAAVAGLVVGVGTAIGEAQCTDNSSCDPSQYCQKTQGDCDGTGECSLKPSACPDIWDPVCGCDGLTYANACEAAFSGINAAAEGECPPPPCQDNDDCGSGLFCLKSDGDCQANGTCSEMPTMCPPIWEPVCGCDGTTYSTDCAAQAAGVNVAYDGECLPSCETNADCRLTTEYCDTAHNGCSGPGACRIMPVACSLEYDPVCGCNEVTFDNACLAALVGVAVAKADICGACPYSTSRSCIFTDACETGATARWSKTVGD